MAFVFHWEKTTRFDLSGLFIREDKILYEWCKASKSFEPTKVYPNHEWLGEEAEILHEWCKAFKSFKYKKCTLIIYDSFA